MQFLHSFQSFTDYYHANTTNFQRTFKLTQNRNNGNKDNRFYSSLIIVKMFDYRCLVTSVYENLFDRIMCLKKLMFLNVNQIIVHEEI